MAGMTIDAGRPRIIVIVITMTRTLSADSPYAPVHLISSTVESSPSSMVDLNSSRPAASPISGAAPAPKPCNHYVSLPCEVPPDKVTSTIDEESNFAGTPRTRHSSSAPMLSNHGSPSKFGLDVSSGTSPTAVPPTPNGQDSATPNGIHSQSPAAPAIAGGVEVGFAQPLKPKFHFVGTCLLFQVKQDGSKSLIHPQEAYAPDGTLGLVIMNPPGASVRKILCYDSKKRPVMQAQISNFSVVRLCYPESDLAISVHDGETVWECRLKKEEEVKKLILGA